MKQEQIDEIREEAKSDIEKRVDEYYSELKKKENAVRLNRSVWEIEDRFRIIDCYLMKVASVCKLGYEPLGNNSFFSKKRWEEAVGEEATIRGYVY